MVKPAEAHTEATQGGQQQRFNAILTGLQENGAVAVDELSEQDRKSVV